MTSAPGRCQSATSACFGSRAATGALPRSGTSRISHAATTAISATPAAHRNAVVTWMTDEGPQLVRFMQESQASIKELAAGAQMKARFERLAALLADPGATAADQLRSRLALVALHFGAFAQDELPGDPRERREAALEVAMELGTR